MALSRVKTWNAAETLTASDLNAEFNNVCNHFGSLDNDDINSTATYTMGELIVGSGITSADGGQLHVHTATAGTIQASADADEAVFENSGASGVTILSGATSTGNIAFGDSGDADNGLLKYTHGATPTFGITVNATAVQSIAAAATTLAHDLAIYQDANNADSQIALGTSATEALFVDALNGGSNKTLEELRFTTKTASGTANHGKMSFYIDEVNIGNINDAGITLESGMVFTGNVTGNASGTAATVTGGTQAAITSCANLVTTGTIGTGVWQGTAVALAYGGTGLVGATDGKIVIADGSGAPVLLDVGSSTAITVLGTVATGTWQGTAVASAYLDADTAHLSVVQTFTGAKTFTGNVTGGVDGTGIDLKLFGDSPGSYLEWDQSEDQLRILGPSADAAGSSGKLLLATAQTSVESGDILGQIDFQAPLETGTDAIVVSASVKAVAQGTFAANVNATDLIFYTAHDAAVAERFRFTSQGEIGIAGANYGTDGQVLTSGGAGAAAAWESVSAGVSLSGSTNNTVATVTGANALAGEANLTFDGTTLGVVGNAGVGIARTEGTLHVHTASAGSVAAPAGADELVVENSASGGISILTPDANGASLNFGSPSDNDYASIWTLYDSPGPQMNLDVVGTKMTITSAGLVGINETANANMTQGLTINQNANDNEILALKSSDVAHGMTDLAETDTYGWFNKLSGDQGGLGIWSATENSLNAAILYAFTAGANSTKSASGGAAAVIRVGKKSGTGSTSYGADENMAGFYNQASGMQWIIDGSGDVYYAGSTNASHWDDKDDIGLLNTFRNLTTGKKAQHVFGEFVQENAEVLHDSGVITMNDDGNHFVSTKGLNALIIDTIRQEGQKWRKVAGEYQDKIAALESRLMRLEN